MGGTKKITVALSIKTLGRIESLRIAKGELPKSAIITLAVDEYYKNHGGNAEYAEYEYGSRGGNPQE